MKPRHLLHLPQVFLSVFVLCGDSVSHEAIAQPSKEILDQVAIEPQIGESLPLDLMFREHQGNEVTIGESLGVKPAVLCLVYFECPMLCKLAADGLVRSLAEVKADVGEDVEVVLVSFDPRDQPKQAAKSRAQLIRRYARPGTDEGWHCLTGDEAEIESLTSALGFHYVWDEATKQYAHAAGLFLISPEGVITDCLSGVEFPPEQLADAIDAARAGRLNEEMIAADEPVSFLRCYLYDPTTGKFGAAVQWAVRVLGIATVIALACGVGWLVRHQSEEEAAASSDG